MEKILQFHIAYLALILSGTARIVFYTTYLLNHGWVREVCLDFNWIFAAARIQTWLLALQASAQSITLWPLRMIFNEVFDPRYYCQDYLLSEKHFPSTSLVRLREFKPHAVYECF